MSSIIILAIIVTCVGWFIWMRRRRARLNTTAIASESVSNQTLALDVFAHGNSYMAEGKFDEAIAAFHQARELDPKRAHVADRLAEALRRQLAAREAQPAPGTP